MAIPRIIIEICKNPSTRHFHVTCEINKKSIKSFDRPLEELSTDALVQIGPVGRKIVESIISMPGIVSIYIRTYDIQVAIGNAFTWDEELELAIVDVLKEAFSACDINDLTIDRTTHKPCLEANRSSHEEEFEIS